MTDEQLQALLGDVLKRDSATPRANEEAAARVLARLGALPRQKRPVWRLPDVLLDWQFAPAWPRVAALASCAVLGFAIGLAGVGRQAPPSGSPYSFISGSDLGTIAFEPRPRGARP